MRKELLVKWAELEPGVCQVHYKENQFLIMIGSEQKIVQGVDTNTLELAWMQYAVQQALDARVLSYNIRRRHPSAWVGVRANGFAVDVFLGDHWLMNDIYYPSLAEALLTAYIGTLELAA